MIKEIVVKEEEMKKFLLSPLSFVSELRKDNPKGVHISMGIGKFTILFEPQDIKAVLSNKNTGRTLFSKMFEPIAGGSLIIGDGEEWKKQRSMSSAFFSTENFDLSKMQDIASSVLEHDYLSEHGIRKSIYVFCMLVLSELIYGESVSQEYIHNILENWNVALESFSYIMSGLSNSDAVDHGVELEKASNNIKVCIREVVNNRLENPIQKTNLLSLMISNNIAVDDIVNQIRGLYMAGFETMAGSLSWYIHDLSLNRNWQDRVRTQVMEDSFEILDNVGDINLTFSESLRLHPPLVFIDRKVFEDIEISSGKLIAGTEVLISPYIVHRDDRYWDREDEYNPNRFLHGNIVEYSYIPYGGGQMKCMGEHLSFVERNIYVKELLSRYYLHMEKSGGEDNKLILHPNDLNIEFRVRG